MNWWLRPQGSDEAAKASDVLFCCLQTDMLISTGKLGLSLFFFGEESHVPLFVKPLRGGASTRLAAESSESSRVDSARESFLSHRQVMMFSATMSAETRGLCKKRGGPTEGEGWSRKGSSPLQGSATFFFVGGGVDFLGLVERNTAILGGPLKESFFGRRNGLFGLG